MDRNRHGSAVPVFQYVAGGGGKGWGGSVAEVELLLRWRPGWGDSGWFGRQADSGEIGKDGAGVGQGSDPRHAGAAVGARQGVRQENSGKQPRPCHPGAAGWSRMGAGLGVFRWRLADAGLNVARWRVAGAGHDERTVGGMRCQDAMVADQVQARRRRQRS